MDFEELYKYRWSCRAMSQQPVEQEKIEKILAAAIAAPTAKNIQNFRIWVIRSEKALQAVSDATKFTFGAGLFFLVGYKREGAWVRNFDGKNFGDVDAAIVATHIMLEVYELGLATTWVGLFDPQVMCQELPETSGYELVALFPVGYPAPDAEPSPRHVLRKSCEELCQEV